MNEETDGRKSLDESGPLQRVVRGLAVVTLFCGIQMANHLRSCRRWLTRSWLGCKSLLASIPLRRRAEQQMDRSNQPTWRTEMARRSNIGLDPRSLREVLLASMNEIEQQDPDAFTVSPPNAQVQRAATNQEDSQATQEVN